MLTTLLLRDVAPLRVLTIVLVGAVVIAGVIAFGFRMLSVTALEGIVVGLVLLWLTTFVQLLAVLAPEASRPSARRSLLRA